MTLGEKIKKLRLEKNLSQSQLGEKLGVHQKQISCYERNINIPSAEILSRIAKEFNMSMDYFVFGDQAGINKFEISDRELLKQLEEIDKLPENDREAIKSVIKAFVWKNKIQLLAANQ